MVAAAVEKKSKWEKRKVEIGKGTEKELLHFLLATDSKIFAQTLYPQVKKKDISNGLILGEVMSMFMETETWTNFKINSNSSKQSD